jgi:pimeloyl-ACP methyl ester carboxylesterase
LKGRTLPTTPPKRINEDHVPSLQPETGSKQRIGWIVAASLVTGLVVGVLLALAPFVPAEEGKVTGGLLLGFALGWAMLAILSARFTDQPQRWAAVPALFFGIGGVLLLAFGSPAQGILEWVWPPALLVLVVWMFIRCRQQLRSRSRWLLHSVFAVLLLASLGGGYETLSGAVGSNDYPMAGELIDVDGHDMHLRCTGSGSPTVILQPGAGGMSSNFGWIEPVVAGDTRVCVYDRPGRGQSEPAGIPQDATAIATDLHTLLDLGEVPGPYLLAGHSFGGLYVLTFAALYPDEVAGMVLVDSTAPASAATPGPAPSGDSGSSELRGHIAALLSSTARIGLSRLLAQSDYGSLPSQSRDEARTSNTTANHFQSTIEEYLMANASAKQAAALVDFAGKPLVVLTAGSGSRAGWMADQDHLATLSSNSAHRVIEGATHAALLHDEQYAMEAAQGILDVISSVRSDTQVVGES